MEEEIVRWRIFFTGRVQGVGFRFTAQILAQGLGVTGWVRNVHDGSVEMEAQGTVTEIRQLINQLKMRPPIRIEDVKIVPVNVRPDETRFSVAPTSLF